jgi:hypothetical protein
MTDEPFWDELGIAWRAATPAGNGSLDRMRASFRRQAQQIRLAVALAVLGGTGLGALGAFTLWQGWKLAALNFGTRGLAVLIVAAILWVTAATLWPVRNDDALSLGDFADLGLARARRCRRAVVLALAGCTAAAVLGTVGWALRTAADHPPALSPVIDLAVLALLAAIVEALRRHFRGEEARFAYLRKALAEG